MEIAGRARLAEGMFMKWMGMCGDLDVEMGIGRWVGKADIVA